MNYEYTKYERRYYIVLSAIIHVIALFLLFLSRQELPHFDFPHKEAEVVLIPETPIARPNTLPEMQESEKPNHKPVQEKTVDKKFDPLSAELIHGVSVLYVPETHATTSASGKVSTNISNPNTVSKKKTEPVAEHAQTNITLDADINGSDNATSHADIKKSTKKSLPKKITQKTTPIQLKKEKNIPKKEALSSTMIATMTSSSDISTEEKHNFLKVESYDIQPVQENSQEDNSEDNSSYSESSDYESSDGTRKRKLRLADLFKDLSYRPTNTQTVSSNEKDGLPTEGAPSVIVQGDIRYHSFIQAILEHINITSIFRNGHAVIIHLIRSGEVKRNLKMNLTLAKNGNVLDASILTSSGCKELDEFWCQTAQAASPFAPLPDHFKREMVRVELVTQL